MTQPILTCTICARGGSKGVPGKNIRPIPHTIAQARATGLFEAIAVSSDSDDILAAASAFGADLVIKRPDELASDTAGKLPAILHALDQVEARLSLTADFHFDLDATSPLRLPEDIRACFDIMVETGCSAIITGAPARRSPYFNLVERAADGTVALSKPLAGGVLRRQDSPDCFDMNASIYGWRREKLRSDPRVFYPDTRIHVMPQERSWDIDDEFDFRIVEQLMAERSPM